MAALKIDDIPEPPETRADAWGDAFTKGSADEAVRFLAIAEQRAEYARGLRAWADRIVAVAGRATDPEALYPAAQGLEDIELRRAESYLPLLQELQRNLDFAQNSPHAWARAWLPVFKTIKEAATVELEILRDARFKIVEIAASLMNRKSPPSPVFSSGADAQAYFDAQRAR